MIVTWPAGDQFCVHTLIVNPAAWPGLMLLEVRVTAMQICGVAFTTASRVAVGVAVGLDVVAWVVGVVVAECELDADALGDVVWVADGVVWVADGEGDGELDGEGLGDGLGVGLGLGVGVGLGCLDGVGDVCGAGLPGTDPSDSHSTLVSRLGRT